MKDYVIPQLKDQNDRLLKQIENLRAEAVKKDRQIADMGERFKQAE